ncbi:MAG: hypothetical protein GY822_18340 [Deltaproteobacteria bacterium]|nr:hypothetical protein [Deltaproteobacteria bacterium]
MKVFPSFFCLATSKRWLFVTSIYFASHSSVAQEGTKVEQELIKSTSSPVETSQDMPSAIRNMEASFTILTEADSNARRRVEDAESSNRHADVDGDLRLESEGSGTAQLDKIHLWARATLGGKLFLQFPDENMSVVRVDTAARTPLYFGFQVAWRSTLKGRVQLTSSPATSASSSLAFNHQRTYGWVQNEFSLKSPVFEMPFVNVIAHSLLGADAKNEENPAKASGGTFGRSLFEIGHSSSGFASKYLNSVGSFVGSGLFTQLSFWVTAKEVFSVRLGADFKAFPFSVPERLGGNAQETLPLTCKGGQVAEYEMRTDLPVNSVFSFTSSRKIFFSSHYFVSRNASNSCGNAFTRHRLSFLLGVSLPASLTLSFDAALQFAAYDDGVGIGQQVILQRDDESQNRVVIRLKRPILELFGERMGTRFYLEGRAAYFSNEFSSESANEGPTFSRIVFSVGLNGGFSLED